MRLLYRIAAYALFAAYIVAYLLGWDWDANARDSLGDDALGEVGEGRGVKAFGAHYGELDK